jgi:hypothetical protein
MSVQQSQNIETINFHGDVLVATRKDEKIMVGVKSVCDNVGLSSSRQLKKLKEAKWATVVIMSSVDSLGDMREISMVDHESIPYWLATVRPNKVSPEVATKLETYQLEVKKVLANHFLAKPTTKDVDLYDPNDRDSVILYNMLRQRQETLELQKAQEAQWQEIKRTEMVALEATSVATEAARTATAIHEQINNRTGYFTVAGYARNKHWSLDLRPAATLGAKMSAFSRKNGHDMHPVDDPRFGTVNSYCPEVLNAFHDQIKEASA